MKIKKSLLSVCLSISLMFGCLAPSISTYAVGDSWSSGQSYTYFQNHFDEINTRLNGVIINQNQLRESFEDYLEEYRDNYNIPNGTTSTTWIGDNISGSYQNGSSGVADLGISQALRQAMRDWCDAYIETNTGFYYAYTWNTADYSHYFNDQDQFHAFITLIDTNNDNYHCLFSTFTNSFILVPNDFFNALVYERFVSGKNFYDCAIYKNWVSPSNTNFHKYEYDSNTKQYLETNNNAGYPEGAYFPLLYDMAVSGSTNSMNWHEVNLNRKTYQVYKTFSSMQNGSEGIQDYYVTDSYNSSISGSYNTTTSNIENTIGSNNVNNYINNYYVQNGEYPTPTQINIYINNYTGDNGGGGSDPDDPSDPNNPDWDFGFLSTIGQFIASLISGIGEVIGGVLEALTSIISSLREGFPNVIGSLLEYFMPFLPEEVVTLISLSIVFAILVGIIKLIRG